MPTVRYRLDPNNPPKMSAEELARLDAMTDEEITAAAESDPDNPPLTEEELTKIETIQLLREAPSARVSARRNSRRATASMSPACAIESKAARFPTPSRSLISR
ncbi:MAG TPA: hypothetical protein VF601_04175 [Beijerinckiaceae bacterium]|jgi:hypothetical protein